MLQNLAYTLILGKPLIMYLGILTYLSFVSTAVIGLVNIKRPGVLPFQWHPRLAVLSLVLASLHGLMGLAVYFNF